MVRQVLIKVLEQRKRYAAKLESLLYNDDDEEETPIETGESAHLIEYLKAWFMLPLKKGSDESRAATHEKRFLKQAFECIKANRTADSAVMLTDTEGDLSCLPIEVKSRCSPRTYDKEMKQIEDVRRMMGSGLYMRSSTECLIQRQMTMTPVAIVTAESVIIHRVLAIYEVGKRIATRLRQHTDLFENDLKSLYLPTNEMPRLSDEWKQAIASDSVKRLKLDEDSFLQRLAIWRVLDVDRSNEARRKRRIQYQRSIELPLPQTVINGIIPMTHGLWNNFKGGSDTSTHVADNVKESVGFRTDNNAACARLLIYFAIAFHRGKQWFHAKRALTFYPSLAQASHANNERAAMYDSLLHLSDTLLGVARKSQLETLKVGLDGMGGEIVQLNVSTSVPEQQTSSRTTRQRSNMPSLGVKTGHTPVNRSKTDEQFEERRRGCLGKFLYCQLIPDPAAKRKGTGSGTEFGECVIGVIAGRITSVLTVGSDTAKDVGIYTCYHAAHRNAWNEHATSNRAAILRAGRDEQGDPAMAAEPKISSVGTYASPATMPPSMPDLPASTGHTATGSPTTRQNINLSVGFRRNPPGPEPRTRSATIVLGRLRPDDAQPGRGNLNQKLSGPSCIYPKTSVHLYPALGAGEPVDEVQSELDTRVPLPFLSPPSPPLVAPHPRAVPHPDPPSLFCLALRAASASPSAHLLPTSRKEEHLNAEMDGADEHEVHSDSDNDSDVGAIDNWLSILSLGEMRSDVASASSTDAECMYLAHSDRGDSIRALTEPDYFRLISSSLSTIQPMSENFGRPEPDFISFPRQSAHHPTKEAHFSSGRELSSEVGANMRGFRGFPTTPPLSSVLDR
ncbi:hypothetical protein THAOC_27454 [Thalassiosira oceanica]|uniref:Uncharacterized protein n=1 Tax=Thalassiosira oceanica TaxID=159749 RepID=K0RWH0_THAOC|nr:hypothetical protein THAOC_27454 [Thalassiosira oceanica]|eukprot:EJK53166.1 hypothetical protein THAOC_27454 [Thalassiosira oceanica]